MNSTFRVTARWWRWAHLRRNPLVRRWDRIESAVLLVLVLFVLAVVPLAAAVGSHTYAGESEQARYQAATRQPATAVLLADAPPQIATAYGMSLSGAAPVPATWALPGGAVRTGTVLAERGLKAGVSVPIWLDQNGNPVAAPLRSDIVVANAISVGAFLWFGAIAACAGVFLLVRCAANRARSAGWEREWARMGVRS